MRNFLFVDGTNLYAGQFELLKPKNYLYFPELIKQMENGLKVKFERIYFYASYTPKPRLLTKYVKLYLKSEALFYRSVGLVKKVSFFKGYRSPSSKKEKEVDVKLSVDVVDMAHRDLFDKLYFWSGDADYMHALKIAERLGKKVEVLALENRIPHRFSYIYPTTIITFTKGKNKIKINEHQKIKFLTVTERVKSGL